MIKILLPLIMHFRMIWDEMLLIWFLQLLDCVKIQAGIVLHRGVAVEGSMSTKSLLTGDSDGASSPDLVTNWFWGFWASQLSSLN